MERRVIAILGCTASGKGSVARELAPRLGAEILSVDSMKVYRGLDIGAAKPSPAELSQTRHHLVNVADAWESFSAARFVELADTAIDEAHRRRRPVLAVGGSVLYFKCLYEGLFDGPAADPAIRGLIRQRAEREGVERLHAELAGIDPLAAARIHRNDLRRVERALEVFQLTGRPISELQCQWEGAGARRSDWAWSLFGLRRERESAHRRVNARVRSMIDAGLVEEARRLYADARGISEQAAQAVGYAELFAHFRGELTLEEAIERIKINSRRLAKQQRTWLRRFPSIHWMDVGDDDNVADTVAQIESILSQACARRG